MASCLFRQSVLFSLREAPSSGPWAPALFVDEVLRKNDIDGDTDGRFRFLAQKPFAIELINRCIALVFRALADQTIDRSGEHRLAVRFHQVVSDHRSLAFSAKQKNSVGYPVYGIIDDEDPTQILVFTIEGIKRLTDISVCLDLQLV